MIDIFIFFLNNLHIIILVFLIYFGLAWLYLKIGTFILNYLFVPALSILAFPNWHYVKKNPEFNSERSHIAVILANDYWPEKILVYTVVNIRKLIKYFKKKGWPYKVYFRVNKQRLKKIINDSRATIIYIIGHGQKHGIKINKKESIYYCEFEKAPKKKFVAQLHCNHYGGKSLVEYISKEPKKSFVTDKKITNFQLNKIIDDIVKGNFHGGP